jgi:vacuolar protein sorting-associated protein 72
MSSEKESDGEDTSSSAPSDVEVAVLARGRRATAGRRLTTLTGQAAEDDDAFWGHDTWGEDDDSDNASFRESDEESEQRVDTFDSDFDDDEDDEVDAEKEQAAQAEVEIARQERQARQKKRGIHKTESKKRSTTRRIIGEGLNAGIVLNAPGQIPRTTFAVTGTAAAAPPPPPVRAVKPAAITNISTFATAAVTRKPRRSTQQSKYSSRFRTARHSSHADGSQTSAFSLQSQGNGVKRKLTAAERAGDKKKPRRFKQEELLIEAIHQTEPDNRRWLLQRQRNQSERDEAHQQAMDRKNQSSGKLIERISSRRGALNLVHFPTSEYVPEIVKGRSMSTPTQTGQPPKCVVTGRLARYRDPETGLPYYNVAAFRELKRRHANRKPPPSTATIVTATSAPVPQSTSLSQPTGEKAAPMLPALKDIVDPMDSTAIAAAAALTLESASTAEGVQCSGGRPINTNKSSADRKSADTRRRKASKTKEKASDKVPKKPQRANVGKSHSTKERGTNGNFEQSSDDTTTPTEPFPNNQTSLQCIGPTAPSQAELSPNSAVDATPSTEKGTSDNTKKSSTKLLDKSPKLPT